MFLKCTRRLLLSRAPSSPSTHLRPILVSNGSVAYKLDMAAKKLPLASSSSTVPPIPQPSAQAASMPLTSSNRSNTATSGVALLELTYPVTAKNQSKAHANPQMLMVHFPLSGQRAAIFPEGSIVGFGFTSDGELDAVRRLMQPFEEPKDPMLVPDIPVVISSQRYTTHEDLVRHNKPNRSKVEAEMDEADARDAPGFAVDPASGALVLPREAAQTLAPCALCLVELVQLRALGTLLAPVAGDTSSWRNAVIATGKLPFSLKQARKRKAQVMRIASRQMKIASGRHQVFWDSHASDARLAFTAASEHYELSTAHSELKERVDAVAQTLVYLSEEAHADTNHRLEWVIIVLISLEVVISVLTHRD